MVILENRGLILVVRKGRRKNRSCIVGVWCVWNWVIRGG